MNQSPVFFIIFTPCYKFRPNLNFMKRFLYLILAVILPLTFASCGQEGPENNEPDVFKLDTVKEASATLMDGGELRLKAVLTGRGYTIELVFGTEDLNVPLGSFNVVNDVYHAGECSVSLNDGRADLPVRYGTVTVSETDGGYLVDLVLESTFDFHFAYEGPLSFELDLEPSGNTLFMMMMDATTINEWWQTVIVSGVMRYAVTVRDPEGETLAYLEFISDPDETMADLAGKYDVKSSGTESGTIPAGSMGWGSPTGSYYIDEAGTAQYITGGKITLTTFQDEAGTDFYTIEGSNLTTLTASGTVGTGSFKFKNVLDNPLRGTVERSKQIKSTYMSRTMKYSVYLPGSYDGTKEFPVLWLLHGYGDDQNSWLDKGLLAKYADEHERSGGREMIVVTPDGLTEFYYGNYEEYFFNELVPEIESKYKVKADAENRAVAGLSMGGFGSLYYWAKYADMFCYAYPCSAAIDMPAPYPSIRDLVEEKDPSELAGMTLEMGLQDTTTGDGYSFHNFLESKGIEHEYIARDGIHDWKFWQECLPKVLKVCGEAFAE